jgi:hypothetical protein
VLGKRQTHSVAAKPNGFNRRLETGRFSEATSQFIKTDFRVE